MPSVYTTTSNPTIDSILSQFEYKKLIPIHDRPDFTLLKTLKDGLKTNAANITTTLGGGAHGHLGLVKSAADYAKVSPVAYTIPTLPPPMVVPHGVAHHEAF